MELVKILLAVAFVIVFIQDYKDRMVHWILFPVIAGLCGYLFYKSTLPELFYTSLVMNVLFLVQLVLVIYLYSRLIKKMGLLQTIGLGDLLMFLAISVSFPTIAFVVLFICSLVFSLAMHLILSKANQTTVPLAGYMSLFMLVSYLAQWISNVTFLYKF